MDTVTCSCLRCHGVLGTFENLWDKIGKTYFSPVGTRTNLGILGGLAIDGEVRAAAKTGVIEGSFLQDLACKGCGEKLGLRCDDAPDGHVLLKNQLILRAGGMSIVSDSTGKKASLRIRKQYALTGQQPSPAIIRDSRERFHTPMGGHIENVPTALVHPFIDENPIPGLLQFAEWAKEAITSQTNDIGRISGAVSKIEKDMKSFKEFMSETRRELVAVPGGRPWGKLKTTVTFLEGEVESLRNELEARPAAPAAIASGGDDDGVKMSFEELDVLTNSITKISQKVNEVENLKTELQFMKTRLKRFEDVAKSIKATLEPSTHENSPTATPPSYRSSMPPSFRVVPTATAEPDQTQRAGIVPRKRKSNDLGGGDEHIQNINGMIGIGQRASIPALAPPLPSRSSVPPLLINRPPPIHRPSRLSHVQLAEEIADPGPEYMDPRSYDSAPENCLQAPKIRRHRRQPIPVGEIATSNTNPSSNSMAPPALPPSQSRTLPRTSSPTLQSYPAPFPPHPRPTSTREIPKRRAAPTTSFAEPTLFPRLSLSPSPALSPPPPVSTPSKRRRRAISEVPLFNEDGVRLTKRGTPDRRALNGRFLKEYHEKVRREKEKGVEAGHDRRRIYRGGSRIPPSSPYGSGNVQREGEKRGELVIAGVKEVNGSDGGALGNAGQKTNVLPSIEGVRGNIVIQTHKRDGVADGNMEREKRAELEARDRLVRETLEREL